MNSKKFRTIFLYKDYFTDFYDKQKSSLEVTFFGYFASSTKVNLLYLQTAFRKKLKRHRSPK